MNEQCENRQSSDHARQLPPCPTSPNCVSSQARRDQQRLEPLTFTGDAALARERLRRTVDAMQGAKLIAADELSLQYEFRSRLFGFIDDVEFLINTQKQQIDFRSASRLGKWDLGVNRRRMESIRKAFAAIAH